MERTNSAGAAITQQRNWSNENEAYTYNEEQISIAVSRVDILKVGSYNVPSSASASLVMYESTHEDYDDAENYERLSGSFTLTLSPTAVGDATITITGTTDIPGGTKRTNIIKFTVYVVNYRSTAATGLSFSGLTADNYHTGRDDIVDDSIVIAAGPDYIPITLEVVEGPGRLYVHKNYTEADDSTSRTSSARKLETSSSAATGSDTGAGVYLDMGGGTNRVTIRAPNQDPMTAIFVYGYPSIEIVSGDDQPGAIGGRLEDPLVVKVKDGLGRGVPMAIVEFSSLNTIDSNERFLPVPGTTVHVAATPPVPPDWAENYADIDDINKPVTATAIYPMTDDDHSW